MTKLAVYTEDKKFYPAVLEVLSNVVADFGIDDVEQWTHTTDRTVPTLVLGHPPEIKPINYITTLSQKQIMSNTAALTLLHAAVTNLLAPVTYPALSYTVLQQPLGMARHVKLGGVLVVDIETGGDFEVLLPQERELISVAINDGKNIYVYSRAALKREDVRTELRQILTSTRKLIAHNAKFDFRTLSEYCGVTIHGHLDTLTFLHALNPGLGNSGLKENCIRLLGATDWESGLKQYINKAKGLFYENIPEDILYKYNAYDVYWTWHLYLYLARAADGDPRIARLARFESRMVNFYQDVEAAGIAVDLDYLNKLDTDLKNEMVGPLAQLKAQVGDENFNPGSWQQVKKYLASIGVAVKSTDEKTLLKERVKMNEGGQLFVDTLLEYRGLVKEHGTYVKGILKRQRDGIVYPTFKVHGTNTGRLSSADPNVQNIPRDTERQSLRRIFVPRAENRKLVSVDYSQAELRVMACLSNDEYLISLFQDGMPDFFDSLMPSAFPRLDLEALTKDEKKNYRAKLKGCVPLTSEILTRRGWLTYDQVRVGDETVGMLPDGTTAWTKIHTIVEPFMDEVVRWGHAHWEADATPDHKWATATHNRHDKCYEAITPVPMSSIRVDDLVVVSGKLNDVDAAPLSEQEVRIISWLLSDGYVKISPLTGASSQGVDGWRQGVVANISQSKPAYRVEIGKLLADVPHSTAWIPKKTSTYDGIQLWTLEATYARELLSRAGLFTTEPDYDKFILSLSTAQREHFLNTFWQAEGHMMGKTQVITQKHGPKLNAVVLCAELLGYNVSVNNYKDNDCAKLVLKSRPHVTAQTMTKQWLGKDLVWCVGTDLGTWTMRQGNRISVTGNTIYGLAYNRKAAAIAESLEMSQREAQAIINNFFQAAPQFYDWRMWVEEMALSEEDTLISPFGRYYQSEVVLGRNRQNIINAGLAFLPQSTASDFCVKAAIAVHEKLQGTDVKIVATIHDAILLVVPDADVQWVSDLTQAEMRASAYETFQAVPFATEATSGSSWEGI